MQAGIEFLCLFNYEELNIYLHNESEVKQTSNESKLAQTWAILDTAAVANPDGETFGKCC